jgi:hypothetical protein
MRAEMALVLHAPFERIFRAFGLCMAGVSFAGGAYLLAEAIPEPLEASEVMVLAAGFTLALGSFSTVYLLWTARL